MSGKSFHPPQRTLIALVLCFGICFGIAQVFPTDGIKVNDDFELVFLDPSDFIPHPPAARDGIEDADAYLAGFDAVLNEDSVRQAQEAAIQAEADSAKARALREQQQREIEARKALLKIQAGPEGIKNLDEFFASAASASANGEKIRVIHYGDSQIEGDRISRLIRNELQKKYGGQGPGLIPPVEVVPSVAIKQEAEGNWKRYTIYGRKDTTVKHSRYGLMGTFAQVDSAGGKLSFYPSNMAYGLSKKFSEATLYYGSFGTGGDIKVLFGDSLVQTIQVGDSSGLHTKKWQLSNIKKGIHFETNASDLEFYGLALDGKSGIQVDNVPMRGSSGTIFKRIDRSQMRSQLGSVNAKLVLLQYGGNSVPYVKDTTQAVNYGNWMRSQIKFLQSVMPDAAFILIGPSDMAYKEKEDFVTYPYLESVRNELKRAAFETGCGFWDIYEVMGGKNSMQAWVDADPPLAGKDYVHFTPKGARRVGELFMKALMDEAE
ncbi:GDSL-type esterase/lipase family protein [Sanyastnella coralliicola]|uniref:GDSL-type esterase/lipase family protein n=1 Tax=Sanyastnella coralliicola TaxID=3069118 RepID=UPI0027BA8384|nr:GDSL-type esterase/lipase family protein [Longitalea sp. SCSIO 12813]